MSAFELLEPYAKSLTESVPLRWRGRVTQVIGNLIESEGPYCSVGESCAVLTADGISYAGEVVGFRDATVLSMCLEAPQGVRRNDSVVAQGQRPSIGVGDALLGRVIDALGAPLDGKGWYRADRSIQVEQRARDPLSRLPIREVLGSGVRALDALLTCGMGQRLGIFGGSGVGKSTLLGMMLRGTSADVTVLALVGERGREVAEFMETIGPAGLKRCVVVASTSDQSALLRMRAALVATSIAEHFANEGKKVLLVVDSVTRFAMAQREIGLAAGEPPTAKGYTPSVLNSLARLVERAGLFRTGSITAFYTVLMEGDDQQDPVVDMVRSLLDGHIVLDRELAMRGHYPPIAVLDSLSRLMPMLVSREHMKAAREMRQLCASYKRSEDLIRIGAYQKGADRVLDRAVELMPEMNGLLTQDAAEVVTFTNAVESLTELVG